MRRSYNGRSHHKLVSEMTVDEHFEWNEKKRLEQKRRRDRKKLERTMEIDTLEEMCDLMCGGVENE